MEGEAILKPRQPRPRNTAQNGAFCAVDSPDPSINQKTRPLKTTFNLEGCCNDRLSRHDFSGLTAPAGVCRIHAFDYPSGYCGACVSCCLEPDEFLYNPGDVGESLA